MSPSSATREKSREPDAPRSGDAGATLVETTLGRLLDRYGIAIVFLVGVIVFLSAIRAPLFLDDYLHVAMVDGTFPVKRSPFDLYAFVDDGDRAALYERGLLPWWSDTRLTIRFFRPLSSALLWVDHKVFAHAALPMHLHSFVWWIAAVLAVRFFFLRFFSRRVTLLATAIFALAPCHSLPLSWVANREALISLAFGALGLSAYARFRTERLPKHALVATLLFALALAGGGEYALAFGGYVAAYDLVRRGETIARRAIGWLPFVVPAVVYLVVRGMLKYGTAGSGFYSDPLRDARAFFLKAPGRAVAQLADAWLTWGTEGWRTGWEKWVLAALVIGAGIGLYLPIRRAFAALAMEPRMNARWLLLGSTMALVPTLAVVPNMRLLGVAEIGVALTVALVLERAWFGAGSEALPKTREAQLAALAALLLGFTHLVHGPGTSWLSSRQHQKDAEEFDTRVAFLRSRAPDPKNAEIGIFRGGPVLFFLPFALDPHGATPKRWFVPSQAGHVLVLHPESRVIELVVAQNRSLYPIGEHNLYRSEDAPLRAGRVIRIPGARVTVLGVGDLGPRHARFELDFDPEGLVWINDGIESVNDAELPPLGTGAPLDP